MLVVEVNDGFLRAVRVALSGASACPARVAPVEALLTGKALTPDLLEKARTTMNRAARAKFYNQAEEIIGEEAPTAFCFSNHLHNVMRDYVKDYVQVPFNPLGSQLDRVWLTK